MANTFDLAEVDRLLGTTRAVRRRLDLSRPVERSILGDCVRLAQQAPTGGNRQGWRWIVVDDADKRRQLADIYRQYGAAVLQRLLDATPEDQQKTRRVYQSAVELVDLLAQVPVHVIPCVEGRLPADAPLGSAAAFYGSIFPAVWSFQLALRSRGLGSVLTTVHLFGEAEAAKLLGIPEGVAQVAMLPVAYTKGTDFKIAARPDPRDITSFDTWSDA